MGPAGLSARAADVYSSVDAPLPHMLAYDWQCGGQEEGSIGTRGPWYGM